MNFDELFENEKTKWFNEDRYRGLKPRQGVDFCSNDYLGFSASPGIKSNFLQALENSELGATGSRLLRGNHQEIQRFEKRLAQFSKTEGALFFPSGYQANVGLMSSLLKNSARVFSDSRNHASIIDGIRLAGCEKYIFEHNDLEDLEQHLKAKAKPDRFNVVVVESIYSMQGDFSPLFEISELCEKHGVALVVDEAHATGLFGNKGAGRVDELGLNNKVLAKVHTAGKALGVSGAWVATSKKLCSLIVNTSRSFIYSTGPASHQWLAVESALNYLENHFEAFSRAFQVRQADFQEFLKGLCLEHSLELGGLGGPVSAVVVKENQLAVNIMESMAERGFDVRAIRPPTVLPGQAQLRITLPLTRTAEEVESFKRDFRSVIEEIL